MEKKYEYRVWAVFGALLALVFAAYWGSLTVPFHFDDTHSVQYNSAVRSLKSIPAIWTDISTSSLIPENRIYRPLTFTTFAISWAMGGGATWPFHLIKMLEHAFACFFVFLIWRRLFSQPGWFPTQSMQIAIPFSERRITVGPEAAALLLALLLAVHPGTVESATYIAATTHLQATTFYLAAFYFFLRFFDDRKHILFLAASLAFYSLAVFSKEEAITLPAVVILATLFLEEGSWSRKIRNAATLSIPYWIFFGGLLFIVQHMMPASLAKSRGHVLPWNYFMTQWGAWLHYMKIWFWPWDLNADNVQFGFAETIQQAWVIQALIGNLLLLGFAFWKRARFPALLFGLLWFYITISPASSFVPLAEPINDHRMYLAWVGFMGGTFAFLTWLIFDGLQTKISPRAVTTALVIVFAGLAYGTHQRVSVWNDGQKLWEDTVAKNPYSGRALNNLALIYMSRAQYTQALDLLNRCEAAWTLYVYCPINKGITYLAMKNGPEAEKSLLRAYSLDPDSTYVNYYLGQYYEDYKADGMRAITYLSRADALSGGKYLEAKAKIADIRIRMGDREAARQIANDISRIDPSSGLAAPILAKLSAAPAAPATTPASVTKPSRSAKKRS